MVASRNFGLKFGVRMLRAVSFQAKLSNIWQRVSHIPRVGTGVWRGFARNIEPLIYALGSLLGAQKLSAESVMVASWDFVLKIGVEVNKLGG